MHVFMYRSKVIEKQETIIRIPMRHQGVTHRAALAEQRKEVSEHTLEIIFELLGQANYIYSLASVPACSLTSPLQADLAHI